MKEKDIQNLIELAESKIHAGVTHAEALRTFEAAGIMDGNGEYTASYQELLREAEQQEAYYFKEPMPNARPGLPIGFHGSDRPKKENPLKESTLIPLANSKENAGKMDETCNRGYC